MTTARDASDPPRMPERFFIGGVWPAPFSTATLEVIDPSSEAVYLRVAAAQEPDMARARRGGRHLP